MRTQTIAVTGPPASDIGVPIPVRGPGDPDPEWHDVLAHPNRCRALARAAQRAGLPIAWANRLGELWSVRFFCTRPAIEALEGVAGEG